MERIKILGIPIDRVTMEDAVKIAVKGLNEEKPFVIITPNSEIVVDANRNKELKETIEKANLIVPDGIGLVIGSKIVGKPLKERVTGIDLMDKLLEYANKEKKSIYLLGAKEGVADAAAEKIKEKYPNIIIAGTHHGYYKGIHCGFKGHEEEVEVLRQIESKSPDMLFIAFGAPKQELFIKAYKNSLSTKLLMGIGGSLDVVSGKISRAPKIYQNLGLEWLYRGIKEPWRFKRMGKLPLFLVSVLIHKEQEM